MGYAFAVPVLPGQEARGRAFIAELLGPRKAEYDDLQRRQGVTAEKYYYQPGPDGGLMIVTGEGAFIPPSEWVDDANPFDTWFFEQVEAITGIDMTATTEGGTAAFLGEWRP